MSIPDDVAKFLDGDVIIDRRNPFKHDDGSEEESIASYCEAVVRNPRGKDETDTEVNKDSCISPTPSVTGSSTATVALPVKHNITGNILNIAEKESNQQFVNEQSPEDQELIQRFLREKDSDAYASLIRILTMENNGKNKKKSIKNILPTFFLKGEKNSRIKVEDSSVEKIDAFLDSKNIEVISPKQPVDNGTTKQTPIAKSRTSSDNSSACSTTVSEDFSKIEEDQCEFEIVNSTWKYMKQGDVENVQEGLSINESPIRHINSNHVAVPQEVPKLSASRNIRARSQSPQKNNKKNIAIQKVEQDYLSLEPQYAYVKPRSPIPSAVRNIVVTKPTIHHPASPDNIPNRGEITKNIPEILKTNMDPETDTDEVELRKKPDEKPPNEYNNQGKEVIVTSSPINNNTHSVNSSPGGDKTKYDTKQIREQKNENLKNVEAFYWDQLRKMKMEQDQELYKYYVSLSGDIQNGFNNNVEKRQPWRCRSVSPNFARPLPLTPSSMKNGTNDNKYGSMTNVPFVRNTNIRNTIGSTSNIHNQRFNYDVYNNNNSSKKLEDSTQSMNVLGIPTNQDVPIYGVIHKPAPTVATRPPIFKKGSLYMEAPTSEPPIKESKRVSFTQTYSQTQKLQSVHENIAVGVRSDGVRNGIPNLTISDGKVNDIYGKIVQKYNQDILAAHQLANKNNTQFTAPLYARVQDKRKLMSNRVIKNSAQPVALKIALSTESESGSEGGEVHRIMRNALMSSDYDDWAPDGKNRGDGSSQSDSGRGRIARRDDPRRHTLGGDLLRSAPPHSALVRGMDIEHSLPRGYPPPSSAMLFDDDPGIMSEVETASTGFRRGGKQRSSLPVVRTPSKTLERPLGLVFLQYRSETKRALLPNEITSIDTVKALFVRSFPKQLTMEYLDSPLVKIYIHDSSKDMFYELEDLRSHLRDIRDRSVLRLFESADVSGGTFPGSLGTGAGLPPLPSGPPSWDQDQSYFSEPEFDSDYHHQHIHKSKSNSKAPAYYMGSSGPSTLPRGSLIRAYSPATGPPLPIDRMKAMSGSAGAPPKPLRAFGSTSSVVRSVSERAFPLTTIDGLRIDQLYSLPADRIHNDGYMSSPERGSRGAYEEPYYTQYVGPPRGGMTPVIDEETGDPSMLDDQYSLYNAKITPGPRTNMRPPPYDPNRLNTHTEDLQQRMRVDNMERQLANLTGLVQKALQAPVVTPGPRSDFLAQPPHFRTASQDKSVSFEKSVSFSDEPPDMNSPKQHSPQHNADTKPPKPAIKSSTLPRMSSQDRDRLKPVPPPKPKTLVGSTMIMPPGQPMSIQSIEYQNYLKGLLKKCKEIRMDMRNLRRLTLTQAHTMREMICDTFVKFRTATSGGGDFIFYEDSMRLAREEEIYKQEMLKLEADLCDLENTVEQLRGSVINRKARVNMVDVERMALVLSKSSKTVADLKVRFPSLHDGIKGMLGNEMEKVVREEKFLKEEPDRLEMALRRCKKLTGTLVTLKRLASVQEQRQPCDGGRISPGLAMDDIHVHDNNIHGKMRALDESGGLAISLGGGDSAQRTENALDALLDELQTFAKPPDNGGPDGDIETEGEGDGERILIKRLRGTVSPEPSPAVIPRGQNVGKPPVPERNPELLQLAGRRAPPPPPPRTSSRSPLASPAATHPQLSASNSSSCDSVDSQEGARARHDLLEQRHQELLRKQKALQEQYARLQQIQRGGNSLAVVPPQDLKKTGSESNLVTKLGLNMSPAAPISGSLTHLARPQSQSSDQSAAEQNSALPSTTNKVYETDIL